MSDPIDPKDKIENECARSEKCKPYLRELIKCTQRVKNAKENAVETSETCMEELIDLTECVDKCVAPRLFAALK